MKILELHRSVTDSNDRDAEELRKELKEKGVFFVNLMSAAGSGKTTLLSRTIEDLKDEYRIAVLEADIEADVDARKIESLGARSIQVHTDGMCHMDAQNFTLAGSYTQVGNIKLTDGTYNAKGKNLTTVLSDIL
ncbi:MAG: hypothetical protein II529_00065, partial [Erysipelotrichaceae bacterium]|nr:hypothetical protein [Erysipelotrichaceae bacterium]